MARVAPYAASHPTLADATWQSSLAAAAVVMARGPNSGVQTDSLRSPLTPQTLYRFWPGPPMSRQ